MSKKLWSFDENDFYGTNKLNFPDIPVNPTPSDASDCFVSENNILKNPDNIKKE